MWCHVNRQKFTDVSEERKCSIFWDGGNTLNRNVELLTTRCNIPENSNLRSHRCDPHSLTEQLSRS
jgi:hypothetical protein